GGHAVALLVQRLERAAARGQLPKRRAELKGAAVYRDLHAPCSRLVVGTPLAGRGGSDRCFRLLCVRKARCLRGPLDTETLREKMNSLAPSLHSKTTGYWCHDEPSWRIASLYGPGLRLRRSIVVVNVSALPSHVAMPVALATD